MMMQEITSPPKAKRRPKTKRPPMDLVQLGARMALRPLEAAIMLGVGRSKLYELLESGELKSRSVGRMRLIAKTDIEKFLAGARERSVISRANPAPPARPVL